MRRSIDALPLRTTSIKWHGLMVGAALAAGPFAAFGQNQARNATCQTCHSDRAPELAHSVHATLDCSECHGGASAYPVPAERIGAWSVPGAPNRPAFDHGPTFAGKPARSAIPGFCGNCHADVERMNPYGIPTDQLTRYWTSAHGKTLRDEQDDRVAVCTDCHGSHDIRSGRDPASRTYPTSIVETCSPCHARPDLMEDFDLPVEIVEEYRQSVHGQLLLIQGDTGAPTCATCHGNHSATPPGFATVSAVCGRCHEHVSLNYAQSVHGKLPEFRGCVQCHGGGEDAYGHAIQRIIKPPGVLIQRYAQLLQSEPNPTPERVNESMNPNPRRMIESVLPTCTACHEELEDDENLPKLLALLDDVTAAERRYVETADHLDRVSRGVLLVTRQRFEFQEAKTHLIELAPLQHTLNHDLVTSKVAELNKVCDQVQEELDELEAGLAWRRRALVPIWLFALAFAAAWYMKYKRLKAEYVTPADGPEPRPS